VRKNIWSDHDGTDLLEQPSIAGGHRLPKGGSPTKLFDLINSRTGPLFFF
jgi:hypothetical protein